MQLTPQSIRYRVDPADVPAEKAARRLHLTAAQFGEALPRLLARGFPAPDPDTGMYDLDAIDAWRRRRHPQLYAQEAVAVMPSQAETPPTTANMGDKFRAAKERKRHGSAP